MISLLCLGVRMITLANVAGGFIFSRTTAAITGAWWANRFSPSYFASQAILITYTLTGMVHPGYLNRIIL